MYVCITGIISQYLNKYLYRNVETYHLQKPIALLAEEDTSEDTPMPTRPRNEDSLLITALVI